MAFVANMTSDSLCVYLNLYSVTDSNNQRLVKSNMLSIFKPGLRRIVANATLDSYQGIFGEIQLLLRS